MRHITRTHSPTEGVCLLPYTKKFDNRGILLNPITVSNPFLSGPSQRKFKRGHVYADGSPRYGKYGNRHFHENSFRVQLVSHFNYKTGKREIKRILHLKNN